MEGICPGQMPGGNRAGGLTEHAPRASPGSLCSMQSRSCNAGLPGVPQQLSNKRVFFLLISPKARDVDGNYHRRLFAITDGLAASWQCPVCTPLRSQELLGRFDAARGYALCSRGRNPKPLKPVAPATRIAAPWPESPWTASSQLPRDTGRASITC
jgi:hypothetical protein